MILIAASKGVVHRFSGSSGRRISQTPMLWDFPVQLHIIFIEAWSHCIFMCGDYQATCPQGRMFKGSCKIISEGPWHASVREGGLDSSIGFVDKILIHSRPLFCR